MNPKRVRFILGVLLFSLSFSVPLFAQNSAAALSGTVTDLSGSPVANAEISVSNVFTGQTGSRQGGEQGPDRDGKQA